MRTTSLVELFFTGESVR